MSEWCRTPYSVKTRIDDAGEVEIADECLDCPNAYVEEIWGEVHCKLQDCPNN